MAKTTLVLHLVFEDRWGKRKTLRLPDPREDITAQEVQAAMQAIVDSKLYEYTYDKAVSAKVVETITDSIIDVIDA